MPLVTLNGPHQGPVIQPNSLAEFSIPSETGGVERSGRREPTSPLEYSLKFLALTFVEKRLKKLRTVLPQLRAVHG